MYTSPRETNNKMRQRKPLPLTHVNFRLVPTATSTIDAVEGIVIAALSSANFQFCFPTVAKAKTMSEPKAKKAKQSMDPEQSRLLRVWPVVKEEMFALLSKGDADTVRFLNSKFPEQDYPKRVPKTHCVFCHKEFDPRMPGLCNIEHNMVVERCLQMIPYPRYSFACTRCDVQDEGGDDDEYSGEPGICREGVCSNDINERLMHAWADDFDECQLCIQKAKDYKKK